MDVRYCSDSPRDGAAWDAYVASRPDATSDHLWGWRRVLAESFNFPPHYLAAVEGERCVGVLPLFLVPSGWGGTALCSIPFGNYGGILADSPAASSALLEAATEMLHRTRARYLELRHRSPLADARLSQPAGAHSRFALPLAGDAAAHWRAMGPDNRSKIQRAKRRGLRLEISRDPGPLYPIHLHASRRQGRPCFPRRYFELILAMEGASAEVFYVTCEGRRIAYYLALFFRDAMVCQFAGSLAASHRSYPNEFLFWCGIEQACARGLREFDFCRSRTRSGTAAFKRKLRFEESPLDYQYAGPERPVLSARSPSLERLLRSAGGVWTRLPVWCTRALGPRVVRYLT